jgi:DNA-binding transcriptional MerR regulator
MQSNADQPGDTAPVYNVKAVATRLGVPAVTLRAWERRYGLPAPRRSEHGYRLYSEYDVRTLAWLKSQTDQGLSIGRAAERLQQLRLGGRDPALPAQVAGGQAASCDHLARRLYDALAALDERTASETLRLAFALYALEPVLTEVVRPALVAVGEAWHAGRVPIATEHFATQFCLRQLLSLHGAAGEAARPGVIVAACAPGERHEIGLLMIVVLLRWRGWDVRYLGPDLSLERLAEAVAPLRPRLLLFTANRPESAAALRALPGALSAFAEPRPTVILGGRGFQAASHASWPGLVLGDEPARIVQTLEALMLGGEAD